MTVGYCHVYVVAGCQIVIVAVVPLWLLVGSVLLFVVLFLVLPVLRLAVCHDSVVVCVLQVATRGSLSGDPVLGCSFWLPFVSRVFCSM